MCHHGHGGLIPTEAAALLSLPVLHVRVDIGIIAGFPKDVPDSPKKSEAP